ncbi:hypothetical protein A4A49_51941 [Nicotiana attenuata]|uniref:Uncharacterized protein n=1 Tax=Nicotiana attenuata TaxID=49451 RepID=A0A314LFQ6_NICAT|nr:hypothetical protein A4A49_51941 [Nicotiana attenuata]
MQTLISLSFSDFVQIPTRSNLNLTLIDCSQQEQSIDDSFESIRECRIRTGPPQSIQTCCWTNSVPWFPFAFWYLFESLGCKMNLKMYMC